MALEFGIKGTGSYFRHFRAKISNLKSTQTLDHSEMYNNSWTNPERINIVRRIRNEQQLLDQSGKNSNCWTNPK